MALNQANAWSTRPASPVSSDDQGDFLAQQRRPPRGDPHSSHVGGSSHRQHQDVFGSSRTAMPKLSCPKFEGVNPKIWKDKCVDYFKLCNVPESMWPMVASLHMEGNAESWLHMYKSQKGLGNWDQFMADVESKFGANDYRQALGQLFELKQTDSVEEYTTQFETLQYQLALHNRGLDDMFFVTQYMRGLTPDISAAVQA